MLYTAVVSHRMCSLPYSVLFFPFWVNTKSEVANEQFNSILLHHIKSKYNSLSDRRRKSFYAYSFSTGVNITFFLLTVTSANCVSLLYSVILVTKLFSHICCTHYTVETATRVGTIIKAQSKMQFFRTVNTKQNHES